MFRFESPQYLWLLWLVVVLVAVRYYSLWRRQKKIMRIGDKDLVRQLMPDASTMRREGFVLLGLSLCVNANMRLVC